MADLPDKVLRELAKYDELRSRAQWTEANGAGDPEAREEMRLVGAWILGYLCVHFADEIAELHTERELTGG